MFMHRNTTDFCMLMLHPETLLNSFLGSDRFLVASSGFSADNKSFADRDSLISFSCLAAEAGTYTVE